MDTSHLGFGMVLTRSKERSLYLDSYNHWFAFENCFCKRDMLALRRCGYLEVGRKAGCTGEAKIENDGSEASQGGFVGKYHIRVEKVQFCRAGAENR